LQAREKTVQETPSTFFRFNKLITKKKTAFFLLFVLSVIPYLGKLNNGFLRWDDTRFIIQRESIHHLGNIPEQFINGQDGLYRPLRAALYSFAWAAFKDSATGYQILGILLHAFCVLAFYFVILSLFRNGWIAFLAATVFAVHPIHVERVAGITASFDLLGDGLLLWAIAAYIK